jgi:hypothetical protein
MTGTRYISASHGLHRWLSQTFDRRGAVSHGTTMVWNLLRRQPGWRCFLEPLHEHLLELTRRESDPTDVSHLGVERYWDEYRSLPLGRLAGLYKSWFGRSDFRLDVGSNAPDLADYLSFLLNFGPRSMLKVTRADFRVPWIRHTFPEVTIALLCRSPRAVWTSSLGRSCRDESSALAAGGIARCRPTVTSRCRDTSQVRRIRISRP